jgi:hypothetical protein
MATQDYVDLTPVQIDPAPQSRAGKQTVFQDTEWDQIHKNHGHLTKEGIQKKVELWKNSGNQHTYIKYQTMLAQCKNIDVSGTTNEGLIIYGRHADGSARWIESEFDYKKRKLVDGVKTKK